MTADAGIHGHDPACDCKQCVTAQRDQLLAFTKEVMQAWPEGGIDGGASAAPTGCASNGSEKEE